MEADEGRTAAQKFAIEVLSVFVPLLLAFSAIMMLAMPGIIWLIDDFGQGGRTNDFSISLARITFPYLGLISVTTLFAAILNSLSRFAAAAAAPIILNICMITALLAALLVNDGNDPRQTAYFLAIAVASAGLVQMLWLYYWARKTGFRFPLKMPRFNADVKELGILILPAVFGAGIYQISRFIDLFFLGRLPEGSFVYLAMADRLNQLPWAPRSCRRCRALSPRMILAVPSDCKATPLSWACYSPSPRPSHCFLPPHRWSPLSMSVAILPRPMARPLRLLWPLWSWDCPPMCW